MSGVWERVWRRVSLTITIEFVPWGERRGGALARRRIVLVLAAKRIAGTGRQAVYAARR
jgi:hypothetical protein